MKREAVISLIEDAFADAPHPGDVLLHPSCHDDMDIQSFYGMRDWRQVDPSVIGRENAALSFFSPAAFRYFLPAFMIWTLNNYESSGSITVDNTIYSLDPRSKDPELQRFVTSQYSLLSHRQRQAVIAFLEYMSTKSDGCYAQAAASALREFWNRK